MIRPLLWLPMLALCATPLMAQEASLQKQAQKLHAQAGGDWCATNEGFVPDDAYQQWTLTYQPSWSDDAPEETVTLIQMFCMSGAYNISYSYYMHTEMEGLRPIGFATPAYDVKYENDDYEGAVEGIGITGMGSDMVLVNSWFDEDAQTITSSSKWRGIGDASSSGTWQFVEGEFILKRFEVDASYDGEINPETILEY